MSRSPDSRREQRQSVDVNATVTVDGRAIVARTRDISRSGICLVSDSEVPRESEVGISLVLSLGKGATSEPLRLQGRPAWCTPLFGKYQIGITFVALDSERRRYLDLFMKFVEGEVGPGAAPDDSNSGHESEPIEEDKDDPFRP